MILENLNTSVSDANNGMSISNDIPNDVNNNDNNHNNNNNDSTAAYSDANSITTFSYFNSNASIISYDSILTNERILDKLDLSQDDKIVLQNVLEEERKQSNKTLNNDKDSRIICVPASQFPSLKTKHLPNEPIRPKINHSNNSRDSIKQLLEKDFTFKDKSLAAQVEQHYASTTRYSYIVEEDCDDDFLNDKQNEIQNNNIKSDRNIAMSNNLNNNINNNVNKHSASSNIPNSFHLQSGRNNIRGISQHNQTRSNQQQMNPFTYYNNHIPINMNRNQFTNPNYHQGNNKIVPNFERYRLDNSRLSKFNTQQRFSQPATGNFKGKSILPNNNFTYPKDPQIHSHDISKGNNDSGTTHEISSHELHRIQSLNDKYNTPNRDSNMTTGSNPSIPVDVNNISRSSSKKSGSQPTSVPATKNKSPFSTPMTSLINGKSTDYYDTIQTPQRSQKKENESSSTNSNLNSSYSLEKPVSQKSHKKKSSLSSFKNLFKTPKAKKSHSKEDSLSKPKSHSENSTKVKDFPSKDSNSSLDLTSSNSSLENSPSLGKSNLRKFIFPPNPNLHFDSKVSHHHHNHNKVMYKDNHYRSLSDMNKHNISKLATGSTSLQASPSRIRKHKHSISTQSGEATLYLDNNKIIDLESHKISTGLSDVSSQENETSREGGINGGIVRPSSPISLSNSLKENILMTPTNETPICSKQHERNKSSTHEVIETNNTEQENQNTNHLITSAINMRIEGKLEASATRLKKACESGNKTAYLLYGLALRHGCGTPEDQKLSLSYIKKATGIESFDEEVFNCNIDPSELEEDNSIPSKLQEPLVPALHECGISYLKGYGGEEVDEFKGLKFLEKAASLNHVDSMCLCGIIWSQKSDTRKKDLSRAAAWFRLADKRGANLIGSDWIYKKKYIKK